MTIGKNIFQKKYTRWVAGAVAAGMITAGIYLPITCGNNQIKQKPTVQRVQISPESTPKTDYSKIYSQINQGLDKYNILPGTGLETPKTELEKRIEKYVKGLDIKPQAEVAKAEKPKYKGLVDFLKSKGIDSDPDTRENIFYGLGMDGEYKTKGNAEQNREMLKQLKEKTPEELKALAAYEHPVELSYAQKKVQEIRENKLEQLTKPRIIPEYGPVIEGEIVNAEGLRVKNKYIIPKIPKDKPLEKIVKAEKDSQFMRYIKEQAATTAIGTKTKTDLSGKSKYDRTKIGDRVNEDLENAGLNTLNSLYGLKEVVEAGLELPGDIANGLSWGLIPDYDITNGKMKLVHSKPEGNIWEKICHPIRKIIGESARKIVGNGLDTVQGATFALANTFVQMPLDMTLGCTEPTRYLNDGLFNTAYITADGLVQNFPFGDASTRVHSPDLQEGWRGLPVINNLYTPKHIGDLAGINEDLQKDEIIIDNSTFRKVVETPTSIIEDFLLFKWISELGGNGSDPAPIETSKRIGGGEIVTPGIQ
ncbi:MAG: hypothetical protein U9R34_03845 [Nanoarchaeota archaeon]|nr:hypothetical protein [Nanoarchaeota archaeon]